MKVFLSWSGSLSREIAGLLRDKLKLMLHTVDFFLSSEDIAKGENFDTRVAKEISEADCAIVFLTLENIPSPWMNFEAGILSYKLPERISNLLIDCEASRLDDSPLARFPSIELKESELFKLIATINRYSPTPINEKRLEYIYKMMWVEIKVEMNKIKAKY